MTGSEGRVGRIMVPGLAARGHEVTRFDLELGDDVRAPRALARAAAGQDAIVHLATPRGHPGWEEALTTVVLGAHHVLGAAAGQGVPKVVNLSTMQVTGCFAGMGQPVALPIDETQPCLPRTPYSGSKLIAEQLCDRYADLATELSIITLRPPAVWLSGRADAERRRWADDPGREWQPFWEYGAFLDVEDLIDAVICALGSDLAGHHVVHVASPDIAATRTTAEMVGRLLPVVPWRRPADRSALAVDPYRSLIDCSKAQRLLGWRGTRTFRPPSHPTR